MRRLILMFTLNIFTLVGFAQSNLGITFATSKSDKHMETLWYQYQFTDNFSVGIQIRNSDVKYRFVDAIAIDKGNTAFAGLTLGFKILEKENLRLDANLTASYRRLENELADKNNLSQFTDGLEIDPNIIIGLKISEKLNFHSGAMIRMTSQLGPISISDEQFFSGILLNGVSYNTNRSTLGLRTYVGPMAGASGDTEKFFWQVSIGYQYSFNSKNSSSSIPFFNF